MALEEADLVLVGRTRNVAGTSLDREVVVYGALVNGCLGLGDEFGAPHVLIKRQYVLRVILATVLLTEFHFAVLSIVIFAPCLEPESLGFLNDGERLTYLETAPNFYNEYVSSEHMFAGCFT